MTSRAPIRCFMLRLISARSRLCTALAELAMRIRRSPGRIWRTQVPSLETSTATMCLKPLWAREHRHGVRPAILDCIRPSKGLSTVRMNAASAARVGDTVPTAKVDPRRDRPPPKDGMAIPSLGRSLRRVPLTKRSAFSEIQSPPLPGVNDTRLVLPPRDAGLKTDLPGGGGSGA